MEAGQRRTGPPKLLLIAGIVLVVAGAGLMDQAGRTQSTFWWDVSGACAFVGFIFALVYLLLQEGFAAFRFGSPKGEAARRKSANRPRRHAQHGSDVR